MFNKEQTSKLISYWLRHNPLDANLNINESGWVPIDLLLNALRLRNQNLTMTDLVNLNLSFDKTRWEFDQDKSMIRATHGHSIPIVLKEKSSIPPEELFHGTAVNHFEKILKYGLMPMQRQFVHLSTDINTANEVGKRHGKPVLIRIDTLMLLNNGFEFYQTSDNVWLTSPIPSDYLEFTPWQTVNEEERNNLLGQLKKEVASGHLLYHHLDNLELLMRRYDCDDTLFLDKKTGIAYLIHLTWQRKQSVHTGFPSSTVYKSLTDWAEKELIVSQKKWLDFNN